MAALWFKVGVGFIVGLSYLGARKTHRDIKKGNVQWVAWKGKYDSVYYEKQKRLNNK